MSNAFVVYVRNEEQVLLMKRADSVSEFPLAWDGIFGVRIGWIGFGFGVEARVCGWWLKSRKSYELKKTEN